MKTVPARVFGVALPVAPILSDLRLLVLDGGGFQVTADATFFDHTVKVRMSRLPNSPAELGTASIDLRPASYAFLARDLEREFALERGQCKPIREVLHRCLEMAEVMWKTEEQLGVITIEEEVRHALGVFAGTRV